MRHAAVATSFVFVVAASLLTGCPDRSISEVDPLQGRVEFKDIPVQVNRDIDLLFLIDDSKSMADKQSNLAKNFPTFIKVLGQIPGGLPNVHIGVATSDLGTKGAEDATAGPKVGVVGNGGCAGLGKAGNLQLNGVTTDGGAQFLSDTVDPSDPTKRKSNYPTDPTHESGVDLATQFATMATGVHAVGCGFEQHLEAIRQALQPTNSVNGGFLRKDAFLAVIIIADEDDCSMAHSTLLGAESPTLGPLQSFRCTRFGVVCDDDGATPDAMNTVGSKGRCHPNDNSAYLTKVADYATFLKGLKDDPNKVIVAGIMGTTEPFATELRAPEVGKDKIPALQHSCNYTDVTNTLEVADPPIRIKSFLDQFPNRSTFASICQNDLSGALQQIAELLKSVVGNPCIEGKLADVDPKTPGPQYDCSVSAIQKSGTTEQTEKVLPACAPDSDAAANKPCWRLIADADKCSANTHLLLKIEGQDTLPTDTHVVANCVTEVGN